MCRALFIFAKLNPGLTYVQGMNELYAPLYYLCAHESGADHAEHAGLCLCDKAADCCVSVCTSADDSKPLELLGIAICIASLAAGLSGLTAPTEADAWYCFVDLISDFRDHFCKQLVRLSVSRLDSMPSIDPTKQTHHAHMLHAPVDHAAVVCLQDNSQMGIKATLSRLNAALKAHDRELWYHLEVKNQVGPITLASGV